MDIKTYIKDGVHVPYTISWSDGENSRYYYILDSNSSNDMLTQAIKDIMIKKYDNFNVYIHNLSRFDGIFLLKILANLGNIKPLIHHGDLISIGFKFNNYNITFKDSQQLLMFYLRNLGKAFGVDVQKGFFPYNFVNENNLNYIGVTPDFSLFDNISHDEYDGITSYNWNLKDEAIKYCEIDCISLYQIIIKFSHLIFDLFNINIHKYPTLSSLAFAIFRTHFLRKDELPQLSGQIDKDIRQGYTGGAVDVYVPQNKKDTKIWVYDVNSLYPYVMNEFDMPVGKPIYFEGDIRNIEPSRDSNLLQPQQVHISERVPTYIPSYPSTEPFSITNGVTSYPSTEPFSFTNSCDSLNLQTFPEYYIQCCLEDSINLKYIFLIIIFILFTKVVYKIIYLSLNNNSKEIVQINKKYTIH
jgi:hypothetical protein